MMTHHPSIRLLGVSLWCVSVGASSACLDLSGDHSTGDVTDVVSDVSSPHLDVSLDVANPVEGELTDWCTGQPDDFSFFVASMDALWALSGSAPGDMSGGFGGDFGGLAGADAICQTIAEATGHGDKTWHAFLSVTDDGSGNPVNAIDRIGDGPWHDANGRLIATGVDGLLDDRPDGDVQTVNDLPDECGIPISAIGDAHDIVTGSNRAGQLSSTDPESTCYDWTSSDRNDGVGTDHRMGLVICGHSFPRHMGGTGDEASNWMSAHSVPSCGKGANLTQTMEEGCIGCAGGYGAIYCFAL